MLQLLNDVLDISSIESGSQRLFLQPTDVCSLVEESIALSRPLFQRKGTQIEVMFQQHLRVSGVTISGWSLIASPPSPQPADLRAGK